jgi:hypothetical protein
VFQFLFLHLSASILLFKGQFTYVCICTCHTYMARYTYVCCSGSGQLAISGQLALQPLEWSIDHSKWLRGQLTTPQAGSGQLHTPLADG